MITSSRPTISIALLAGVLNAETATPVKVDRSTSYYDVSGTTAGAIRSALDRNRPNGPDGNRHDGVTNWHVDWSYRYQDAEGGCRLTELTVSLRVQVILPRWVDESTASTELRERWRGYVAALTVHEQGHDEIGSRAATLISRLRERAGPRATCRELENTVNQNANEVLEEARQRERAYDMETDHGRTQGARFP